jgi:hypothetical protein
MGSITPYLNWHTWLSMPLICTKKLHKGRVRVIGTELLYGTAQVLHHCMNTTCISGDQISGCVEMCKTKIWMVYHFPSESSWISFWWSWNVNSGLHTCKAGAYCLSHTSSLFCFCYFGELADRKLFVIGSGGLSNNAYHNKP